MPYFAEQALETLWNVLIFYFIKFSVYSIYKERLNITSLKLIIF
jgi:hypothetical protein